MKILAVIPARAGSKRIVGKNTVDLGGKPLIQWTIEAGLNSSEISRVVVCTDAEKVKRIAYCKYSVQSLTPLSHDFDRDEASDAVIAVLKENATLDMYDVVIMLLPTSPFRTGNHIDEAINKFLDKKCDGLISVVKSSHEIRKLRLGLMSGYIKPMISQNLYTSNGSIQISRPEHLKKHLSFHEGNILPYVMHADDGIDIDTLEDLEIARHVWEERHVTA